MNTDSRLVLMLGIEGGGAPADLGHPELQAMTSGTFATIST